MKKLSSRIDFHISLIPFTSICILCIIFILFPDKSNIVLSNIRNFLNIHFGNFYLFLGLFSFFISLLIAFSPIGKIKLGNEKKTYSNVKWGALVFTAGLAADIIFYSLCEWIMYANENHIINISNSPKSLLKISQSYSLFHWGLIPWSFYMILAASFGFMLYIKNSSKQRYSEACRPLLGTYCDRLPGKIIDLLAVFALIAGTATTFSISAPLLSLSISKLLGINTSNVLTIFILVLICIIYATSAYFGMKNVVKLASYCSIIFLILLAYVFFFGNSKVFTIKNSIDSGIYMAKNFIKMATLRNDSSTEFSINYTVFYWAYWIVWCVGTPFFIGSISKGRTIKETILGGYFFGILGTFSSFMILGNFGMNLQLQNKINVLEQYADTKSIYDIIIEMLSKLPFYNFVLILLVITMITFYATSFDSLTLISASYSYKDLAYNEEPDKVIKLLHSILLILLPIALIFSNNSMANLQTVSIIAAFPIGFIIIIIVLGFIKDAFKYIRENKI